MLHSFDLAPHRRAIGRVERQERTPLVITRGVVVGIDQCLRQVAPAVESEIHGEEGHVCHGIGITEPLVEFDAVDDDQVGGRRAFGEQVNMLEPQVAVAVAWHAALSPALDRWLERGERLLGQRGKSLVHSEAERRAT